MLGIVTSTGFTCLYWPFQESQVVQIQPLREGRLRAKTVYSCLM
jgi:hypothetical protein